jgi:hypothetical protein
MPERLFSLPATSTKTLPGTTSGGGMVSGISGFKVHPERDMLIQYSFDVPVGTWLATLQAVAWGKSHNLLCYFTSEENGDRYVLSTFWNRQFRPHLDGPEFDKEALGSVYEITTEISKNGRAKFVTAKRLQNED